MKIARIEAIPLAIPHDHGGPPPSWGGQEWDGLTILLVRIDTEDGATGWGEAFSYNCMPAVKAVVEATVAPVLIGRDASDIAAINRDLQQALHLFGRYGITLFGISAVDIALWDLAGKRAGLPLGRLLGGPAEPPSVPGYASLFRYRDRELVAETARAALAEGYPAIKLHETEEPEIAAARAAMGGGVPLSVDVNCPWTPGRGAGDGRPAQALRPALAGGADLPARGFFRPRPAPARIRDRPRLRRERVDVLRVPEPAGSGGGALRPAERYQARRGRPSSSRCWRSPRPTARPSCRTPPISGRAGSPPSNSSAPCRSPAAPAVPGSSASTRSWRRRSTRAWSRRSRAASSASPPAPASVAEPDPDAIRDYRVEG